MKIFRRSARLVELKTSTRTQIRLPELSTLPPTISLVDLVAAAKMRWRIELDDRHLKDELGLDHFKGRTLPGWERHVTVVTVAYHFLVHQQLAG